MAEEKQFTEQTKSCPKCGEEIKASAKICKHCKADLRNWFARHKLLTVVLIFFALISISVKNASKKVNEQVAIQKNTEEQKKIDDEKAKQDPQWQKTKAGKVCATHADWTKQNCEDVAQGKIWIGMSYDMLVASYGKKPDSANPSNYGNGTKWQYCWTSMTPSCFYDDNNDKIIDSYN